MSQDGSNKLLQDALDEARRRRASDEVIKKLLMGLATTMSATLPSSEAPAETKPEPYKPSSFTAILKRIAWM